MSMNRKLNVPWYECEVNPQDGTTPRHEALFAHCRAVEEDQMDIHLMNNLNSRLYSNREPTVFQWNSTLITSVRPLTSNEDNVVQAVVDTLVARIGSMKPKATIYTRGADFSVYRRGRALDKYLWGQFQHMNIHMLGRKVFRDALVYGTGFLKLFVDADNELCAERVNPDEIIVDQRECVSSDYPLQMHHRRLVSRYALMKKYPKHADLIKEAQSDGFQYTSYRTPNEEQLVVVESWCMGKRHTIAIENGILFDEPYKHDKAPIIPLRWAEGLAGFYGRSVVSDLVGYQIRLNKLNTAIDAGQDLMCVPRLFVDQGSSVLDTRFDNQAGKIIKYRGKIPEAITWAAFNAEIYNERERLWLRAHESQGVSVLASSNKLPTQARLDSSDALREYNAISDERFNDRVQSLEEWYLTIAKEIIRLSKDLYQHRKFDTSVAFRSGNVVEQIDWSKADLEADKYVMNISASSVLNMTPAARRDKLNFWLDRQLITPEQYKAWSGEPDLETIAELASGNYDALMADIEAMMDGETDRGPDPNSDLAANIRIVNATQQHIRSLGAPEDVLQIFDIWLLTAEALVNQPVPAPPAAAMGGIDPMTGMPMQPPLSAGAPGMPGMGVPPMVARPGELSPPPLPNGPGVA